MKKIKIFAGTAALALAILATSCDGGSVATPKAEIKTETDTLSYALGVQLADNGLNQYLQQLGVIQDTAMVKATYRSRIDAEKDQTKKAELEKELNSKIDSLNKANNSNMVKFVQGLKDSYNASDKKEEAYYNGLQIGSQLKAMSENFEKQALEDGQTINKNAFLSGLIGTINKETPIVNNTQEILQAKEKASQERMIQKQQEEARKTNAPIIEAGEKFLAENKTKEGVVVLPSGLQYKILKEGKGPKPTATDQVEVFYKGSLIDGTVFETNFGKESIKFPVNQVIPGWTEALQLMPVGSKWILYIPADLAYGPRQAGNIPPFSTLIFEIDLVGIVK